VTGLELRQKATANAKANAGVPPLPHQLRSGSGRDDAVFEGGLELGRTVRGVGGVEELISRIDSLFLILLRE
jgi:hypothetical protein